MIATHHVVAEDLEIDAVRAVGLALELISTIGFARRVSQVSTPFWHRGDRHTGNRLTRAVESMPGDARRLRRTRKTETDTRHESEEAVQENSMVHGYQRIEARRR
jgi:hypothetical protein